MEECNHTRRSLCHQTGNRGKVWLKKQNETKQVELDERKKEGEISYMGLEGAIGSIQEICLAKPVESSTVMPTRKLTNMSNEDMCEGQVHGLYTRERVEDLKTHVCAYIQTHSWYKNTGGNTLPSRVHTSSEEGGGGGTGRIGMHWNELTCLSLLFSPE